MEKEMITRTSNELCVMDADLVQRWIAYIDVAPKSGETYTRNIKPFLNYCNSIGKMNPADVTRADIITYREKLQAEGKKAATVQAYLAAVKIFFKWLESEGVCENVTEHVKGKKVSATHKTDWLSVERCNRLIDEVDTSTIAGLRDYALLALAITTGLRTISISLANVEDIRTMGDDGIYYLFYQGKGHDDKDKPALLTEPVYQAIQLYLSARGHIKGTDPLFASTAHRNHGERMTTRSISRICKEHMVDAGINSSRLTAHSLRHTAGMLAFENGASLSEVQQMMDHSSPVTTQRYLDDLNRKKNQCEAIISNAIFGTC